MTNNTSFSIIATGITTLDEARYFAAMGADWLGFNSIELKVNDIKTIAEWVVGPKMFIEFEEVQEDRLFEISNQIQLHGICVPPGSQIPAWYQGDVIYNVQFPSDEEFLNQTHAILLLRLNSFLQDEVILEGLHSLSSQNTCWISLDTNQISLNELVEKIPALGIVIRCRKVASRDADVYEQYDAFFAEIEAIRASG